LKDKSNRITLNYSKPELTALEKRKVNFSRIINQVISISDTLHLIEHTLKLHCKTARAKTGAKNVTELVAIAIRRGLI
jgi:DNA-binding CsgD family transcriptional regulator